MGYKFKEDGKSFVFLTDNELGFKHRNGRAFEEYVEFSKDADLLIHDSEYTDDEYLTTRKAGGTPPIGTRWNWHRKPMSKPFGLFHHNQNRSDKEQDMIVEECRSRGAQRKQAHEAWNVLP
jgi:hypothetical protein